MIVHLQAYVRAKPQQDNLPLMKMDIDLLPQALAYVSIKVLPYACSMPVRHFLAEGIHCKLRNDIILDLALFL
jgi:hypothetical protein